MNTMMIGNILVFLTLAAFASAELIPLNYTHDGDDLQGFLSKPANATADNPVPAIVILPDWDGVNDYEKRRAEMISTELNYVSFAADIYGANLHEVTNETERRELAGFYRENPDIFAGRIQAAVDLVRTVEEVDTENVAIIGYCFGGTGVLIYGLLAINDVKALVSFHGGLTTLPDAGDAVTPKVLVLSGGEDDTSTDIMDLEMTLDAANADWEITRYSGIEHAFTVFDNEDYNEWADMRSWQSMKEFVSEAFGKTGFVSERPEIVDVQDVNYTDVDGTELRGYLAKPSDEWQTPFATVVILPDWDGNNEYEKERAMLLSELGYVGFAADIYGADLQSNLTQDERIQLASLYRNNMTLFVQRIERAIKEVKTFDFVDVDNIAVIGYCFGGTGIIQLAFSGNDEVKVVVSFHGGLTNLTDPTEMISPYTLILSGGDDDAHGNQTELEAALNAGEAQWEITRYSGVVHGFTVWDGPGYSLKADDRSWESMLTAFYELMPAPVRVGETRAPVSVPATSPTQAPANGGPSSESSAWLICVHVLLILPASLTLLLA